MQSITRGRISRSLTPLRPGKKQWRKTRRILVSMNATGWLKAKAARAQTSGEAGGSIAHPQAVTSYPVGDQPPEESGLESQGVRTL